MKLQFIKYNCKILIIEPITFLFLKQNAIIIKNPVFAGFTELNRVKFMKSESLIAAKNYI